MGLFDDLYKPYNQIASAPILPAASALPAVPTATPPATPAPTVDPLHVLLTSLLAPKTNASAAFDFAGLLKALRNDPVGDANRLTGQPSYAPDSQSPFNTGFFKNQYLR